MELLFYLNYCKNIYTNRRKSVSLLDILRQKVLEYL